LHLTIFEIGENSASLGGLKEKGAVNNGDGKGQHRDPKFIPGESELVPLYFEM
jgi:hypothetical protein